MPWKETRAMDERARFVLAVEAGEEPVAAVCRRFGISRQHGYKWLERWRAEGVGRARRPVAGAAAAIRRPWRRSSLEACLDGAARASDLGAGEGAGLARAGSSRRRPWPAASTIGALFDREGLTVKRRLRRRAPPGGPLFAADAANDVWTIDFKGWFRTGDGIRVDPLTLADACSRYLLRCQAVARCDTEHVWPILDAAFREYGLPLRLRSDNGPPFATIGAGGLSRLSVQVIKAGVIPERITPGKPQENGRHERLHLTLLQDTADPPAATLRAQAGRFRTVPAHLQRGAPARGPRQRDAGRALRPLAAALGRGAALARARGRRGGPPGEEQRPDQLARAARLCQRGAGRRAGRPRRDRGRPLDGALRPDPARLPRASRRPAGAATERG